MPPSNFLENPVDNGNTTTQHIERDNPLTEPMGRAPLIAIIVLAAVLFIATLSLLVSLRIKKMRKKEITPFLGLGHSAATARGRRNYPSDTSINPLLYEHGNWPAEEEKIPSLSMYSRIASQQTATHEVLERPSRRESPRPPSPTSVPVARTTRTAFSSPRTSNPGTSYKQVSQAEVSQRPLLPLLTIPQNNPGQTNTSRQMSKGGDDSPSSYSPTPVATTPKRTNTMSTYVYVPTPTSESMDEEMATVSGLLRARAERSYTYLLPTRKPSTVSRIDRIGSIKSFHFLGDRASYAPARKQPHANVSMGSTQELVKGMS